MRPEPPEKEPLTDREPKHPLINPSQPVQLPGKDTWPGVNRPGVKFWSRPSGNS